MKTLRSQFIPPVAVTLGAVAVAAALSGCGPTTREARYPSPAAYRAQQELRQDSAEIRQGQQELRRDYRAGRWGEVEQDRRELAEDRQELREDRRKWGVY